MDKAGQEAKQQSLYDKDHSDRKKPLLQHFATGKFRSSAR